MLPPRLAKELDELRAQFPVEVTDGPDFIEIVLGDVPTGSAFSQPKVSVLLRVPRSYPDAGLDMFWTDVSLTLTDGTAPQAAEVIEQYAGRAWRRFSWHHGPWNATVNNLQSYVEFVRRRFRER
jgi:hypothetical protein